MIRFVPLGALLGALTLALLPTSAANAATTITADLGDAVPAGATAPFGFTLAGTTGEDLIVSIDLAEGTMSLDDTGLGLSLQPGSVSFADVETVTFTGSSAAVITALADRLTWTAPATPAQSPLRLSISVGSHYAGLVTDPTSGQRYLFPAGTLSWPAARDAAAALTYNGLTGYLVTITSSAENTVVSTLTNSTTHHIAATSEIAYVNPLLPSDEQYANEGELRGIYHWAAGPEAGQRVTDIPWFPGEPNGTVGSQCLLTNWFPVPEFGPGLWNDSPCGELYRYVVEFGGLGTDVGPALYDNLGTSAAPAPELAATGADPLPGLVGASLALVLGLGMLAQVRRRRTRP